MRHGLCNVRPTPWSFAAPIYHAPPAPAETDYDVFDGDRNVRRIYLIYGYGGNEIWFSGLTGRQSYGHVSTLKNARRDQRAAACPMDVSVTEAGSAGGRSRSQKEVGRNPLECLVLTLSGPGLFFADPLLRAP